MFKVQFDARVFNPDTEEYVTGWIDPARPYEVRELHTDVPTFEYYNRADALEAVEDFMGSFEEEDRNGDKYCYAEDEDINYETGESYTYGAHIECPVPVPVQITVDFTLEYENGTIVTEIAGRIREMIEREYMADGEDRMGYDGPMVTAKPVTTLTN